MKTQRATWEIITEISDGGMKELKFIEEQARACYQSEWKMQEDGSTARPFCRMLVSKGHHAMLEHSMLTVKFTCDRAIANEIVRHRHFSFAQESTRYCNYANGSHGNDIIFIEPYQFKLQGHGDQYRLWYNSCELAEKTYKGLIKTGCTPEWARSVLPLSTKTTLVVTGNYRTWIDFLATRTKSDVHPQMLELTLPLLKELQHRIPVVFDYI